METVELKRTINTIKNQINELNNKLDTAEKIGESKRQVQVRFLINHKETKGQKIKKGYMRHRIQNEKNKHTGSRIQE